MLMQETMLPPRRRGTVPVSEDLGGVEGMIQAHDGEDGWSDAPGQDATLRALLRNVAKLSLDLLLPARCLACGEAVIDRPGGICSDCWWKTAFLAPPWCDGCGTPFELPEPPGTRCAACLAKPPVIRKSRSCMIYDDRSRAMILRFKHADRTDAARGFVQWLLRSGGEVLDGADLLIPIPLHPIRLFRRRYNQAGLLARGLSRLSGVPDAPLVLRRVRRTPSQGRLSRTRRAANVRGAFAVPKPMRPKIEGRTVVLIDDVQTTGATLDAAARILLRSGAAEVRALTLARVIKPPTPT